MPRSPWAKGDRIKKLEVSIFIRAPPQAVPNQSRQLPWDPNQNGGVLLHGQYTMHN